MASAPDIYLAYFSLQTPPRERFEATARAGFAGTSIFWDEVDAIRKAEGGLSGFKRLIKDNDITTPIMEFVPLPSDGGDRAYAEKVRDIAQTAADIGCETVVAVALDKSSPFAALVQGFGTAAEACRAAGLDCVIEFVPLITAVPDLATARKLLAAVNAPQTGMVIDALHFYRSGAPWSELEALHTDDIHVIQVNDAPLVPSHADYGHECMALRRVPGEGEFDLARFVRTLDAIAPDIPLSAEIMSSALYALPPTQAAQKIAEATRPLQAFRKAGM